MVKTDHNPDGTDAERDVDERAPVWLFAIGILLLVGLMAVAAFSLGVYVAERGLLR